MTPSWLEIAVLAGCFVIAQSLGSYLGNWLVWRIWKRKVFTGLAISVAMKLHDSFDICRPDSESRISRGALADAIYERLKEKCR